MCKISSYLRIEELANATWKSCTKSCQIAECLHSALSSSEVSKDWTQGRNTLSFIEIRGGRNVLVRAESSGLHA